MVKYTMFTDMPTRLERAKLCQQCDKYRRSIKQCTECGCIVNFKIMLAEASCPIGKWHKAKAGDILEDITNKQKP